MVKQVLLCGCGNIGFRHLQALSAIKTAAHVTIVEPFVGGHGRITDFIATDDPAKYTLLNTLPQAHQQFDLVVIATSADVRQMVFEDIIKQHDIACIIFEKILFQSVAALNAVDAQLDASSIPAFVNCGRRGFDSYQALASEFAGHPTDVTVNGTAFGLASNAVHFLDLAEFLNNAAITDLDLTGLKPGSIPSKRADFVEIFGTLKATLDNGAKLSVTCANEDAMTIGITLNNAVSETIIDELSGQQSQNGTATAFAIKHVSGMPYLYDDALTRQDPGLTPYKDSARQHRFYLRQLCQHLGLPSGDDTLCPIS